MIFLFPLDVVLPVVVVLVVVGPLLGGVAVVVVVADVLNTAPLLCAAVNRVNSMCHNHFKSILKRPPKMIKQSRPSNSTSTLKAAADLGSELVVEICTQVHSLRRHEPTCSKFEQAI